MNATLKCPDCGAINELWVPRGVVSHVPCAVCGENIVIKDSIFTHGRGSAIKKRSKDQEKRAAKRWNARGQPGSGAMDHTKGDVRKKGVLREECKFTLAKSYTIKLEELLKIEREASGDETPFLEIEFQGIHPYRRYCILPEWALQSLMEKRYA
jgi:hypothetical protein